MKTSLGSRNKVLTRKKIRIYLKLYTTFNTSTVYTHMYVSVTWAPCLDLLTCIGEIPYPLFIAIAHQHSTYTRVCSELNAS